MVNFPETIEGTILSRNTHNLWATTRNIWKRATTSTDRRAEVETMDTLSYIRRQERAAPRKQREEINAERPSYAHVTWPAVAGCGNTQADS